MGASSADIRLETRVTVKGTDAPNPYEGRAVDCYLTADIRNVPDDQFKALLGRDVPDSKVVICFVKNLIQNSIMENRIKG